MPSVMRVAIFEAWVALPRMIFHGIARENHHFVSSFKQLTYHATTDKAGRAGDKVFHLFPTFRDMHLFLLERCLLITCIYTYYYKKTLKRLGKRPFVPQGKLRCLQ